VVSTCTQYCQQRGEWDFEWLLKGEPRCLLSRGKDRSGREPDAIEVLGQLPVSAPSSRWSRTACMGEDVL
jgi:hypothetical protein